ncbi:hypothetical protein BDY17DRAFT_160146 [Neohortaea acidophila]|uniref:Uncharacterized protein n=1 Tax=Neohortaea acidophila TaxID=245834 RepID=A0A6A6PQR6_9PEZI|nr:uncharacterized protein BDY17DRAFT_160146 [Neohortaea acidophila]KAF2482440.1 hypothetical protein BDY17DRAFT_160146 [Neohortaea acidophila]
MKRHFARPELGSGAFSETIPYQLSQSQVLPYTFTPSPNNSKATNLTRDSTHHSQTPPHPAPKTMLPRRLQPLTLTLSARLRTPHHPSARQFTHSARLTAGGSSEAFNPKTTRPEEQKESAGKEAKEGEVADTSPVSKTANTTNDPQTGGAQGSKSEDGAGKGERQGGSGHGSAPKAGKT